MKHFARFLRFQVKLYLLFRSSLIFVITACVKRKKEYNQKISSLKYILAHISVFKANQSAGELAALELAVRIDIYICERDVNVNP